MSDYQVSPGSSDEAMRRLAEQISEQIDQQLGRHRRRSDQPAPRSGRRTEAGVHSGNHVHYVVAPYSTILQGDLYAETRSASTDAHMDEVQRLLGTVLERLPEAGLNRRCERAVRQQAMSALSVAQGIQPQPRRLRRLLHKVSTALVTGIANGGPTHWPGSCSPSSSRPPCKHDERRTRDEHRSEPRRHHPPRPGLDLERESPSPVRADFRAADLPAALVQGRPDLPGLQGRGEGRQNPLTKQLRTLRVTNPELLRELARYRAHPPCGPVDVCRIDPARTEAPVPLLLRPQDEQVVHRQRVLGDVTGEVLSGALAWKNSEEVGQCADDRGPFARDCPAQGNVDR